MLHGFPPINHAAAGRNDRMLDCQIRIDPVFHLPETVVALLFYDLMQ